MGKWISLCVVLVRMVAAGQNGEQDIAAEKFYRTGLNALRGTPPSQNVLQAFSDIRRAAELG